MIKINLFIHFFYISKLSYNICKMHDKNLCVRRKFVGNVCSVNFSSFVKTFDNTINIHG